MIRLFVRKSLRCIISSSHQLCLRSYTSRHLLQKQKPRAKPLAALLSKLELSLKECSLQESWATFSDIKTRYGYPNNNVVVRLLNDLANSGEIRWKHKARTLTMNIISDNPGYLGVRDASMLALTFSRSQMAESSAAMLRMSFVRGNVPYADQLRSVFMHLVKSRNGACLASNLLFEICELGLKGNDKAVLFNLTLDACVRDKEPIKGGKVVELMAERRIVADAHTVVLISRIHEMNRRRDEMKRLSCVLIGNLTPDLMLVYCEVYDILLSQHFSSGDIDAAAELVKKLMAPISSSISQQDKMVFVSIGSQNIKEGLKLQVAPHAIPKEYILEIVPRQEMIIIRNGSLHPSHVFFARMLLECKRQNRVSFLTKFVLEIHRDISFHTCSTLFSDIADALIRFNWLNEAHDVLEDAITAGISLRQNTIDDLVQAYRTNKMLKEAEAARKKLKDAIIRVPSEDEGGNAIGEAMKEWEGKERCEVDEMNNSMYYFCKARMVGDAVKTYRRMEEMKVRPTMQSYGYLCECYEATRKLRSVTILWGDVKRRVEKEGMEVSRDLYEVFLMCFMEGGYFERVMELIKLMEDARFFVDKIMVRNAFLKRFKNLYRNLNELHAKTPAQKHRLRFVQMFRKWASVR